MVDRPVLRNTLANLGGTLLHPVLSIVLVPFYVAYLGLEGYGLIGFFSVVLALLGVFTKGIGTALQKEVAVRHAADGGRLGTLVRSHEVVYAAVGLAIAAALVVLAFFLALRWVVTTTLSAAEIQVCLILIAVRVALALPQSVYQAALFGMERQVRANAILSGTVLVAAIASVIVVVVTRSIVAFYVSELAAAAAGLAALRIAAFGAVRHAAAGEEIQFDAGEVSRLWKFSAGMFWSHGIGLVLTQIDRVAISRLLPLSALGVFTAASAGGRVLGLASAPYLTAVFPRNCQIGRSGDLRRFTDDMLQHARVVAAIALILGVPLFFFAAEILHVWTRNTTIAAEGAAVLRWYVVANVALALASVFYQSELALNAPRFAAYFNTVALVWLPLSAWTLTRLHGVQGAAAAWAIFCLASWMWNFLVVGRLLTGGVRWRGRYALHIVTLTAPFVAAGFAARLLADRFLSGRPAAATALAATLTGVLFAFAYVQFFGLRPPRTARVLEPSSRETFRPDEGKDQECMN